MKLANTLTKLPAIVGVLSLFAASAHAAIVQFQPTRVGGVQGGGTYSAVTYGTVNHASGNQQGTTAFETTGGNGFQFFYYVLDNTGNSNNTVGVHTNWGASSLGDDFPSGFTILITPLGVGDRGSAIYGAAINQTAPDILTITNVTAGSFQTSYTNPLATHSSGAVYGWKIELTAVPEPSAALLGGLGMLALLRRRRA